MKGFYHAGEAGIASRIAKALCEKGALPRLGKVQNQVAAEGLAKVSALPGEHPKGEIGVGHRRHAEKNFLAISARRGPIPGISERSWTSRRASISARHATAARETALPFRLSPPRSTTRAAPASATAVPEVATTDDTRATIIRWPKPFRAAAVQKGNASKKRLHDP